jgi:hypothetical protein
MPVDDAYQARQEAMETAIEEYTAMANAEDAAADSAQGEGGR